MKSKKTRILLIIVLLISIAVASYAWFIYHTQADTKISGEIAFYILETGTTTEQVALDSLVPGGTYTYEITVSNTDKDGNVSQVNMEYGINIRTTTNLPLTYSLKEVSNEGTENDVSLSETITNTNDGVWYKNIENNLEKQIGTRLNEKHTYKLIVNFPIEYTDEDKNIVSVGEEYSYILELIEITIDANQKNN